MQDLTSPIGPATAELQRSSAPEAAALIAFEVPEPQLMIDRIDPALRAPARRLRQTGFGREQLARIGEDDALWKFQRNWKGISWVVLCNFRGSLGYRMPSAYIDVTDPYRVLDVHNLPDTATDADRAHLRKVRALFVGPFPKVVERLLGLPDLPGHSHFPPLTDDEPRI